MSDNSTHESYEHFLNAGFETDGEPKRLWGLEGTAAKTWSSLGLGTGAPDKIETLRVTTKGERTTATYRMIGAGPAGTNVIAKRQGTAHARHEYLVYTRVLAKLPIASVRFYGLVEDDDATYTWIFLEDAGDVFLPKSASHLRLTARWLAQMHASAVNISEECSLPDRGPNFSRFRVTKVRRLIADIVSSGRLLTKDESENLDAIADQCYRLETNWNQLELCCNAYPKTVVHCDFTKDNIRVRSQGERQAIVVFDWERSGWGMPAIDVSQYVNLSATADITAYYNSVYKGWKLTDISQLKRLASVGTIFRLQGSLIRNLERIWANRRSEDRETAREVTARAMESLRDYPSWLSMAIDKAQLAE